ncbi:hypothetical protein ACFE04_012876 [Oxalis oulophora]
MSGEKTIVWFRRDLRISDNPALASAARNGCVLPVFIWCPKEEGQFYPGRVSRWWLKQSLANLKQSLNSLGADLLLIKSQNTLGTLLDCIDAYGATKLVFNHLYGMLWFLFLADENLDFLGVINPVSLVRDHNIKEKLSQLGISVQSYNGDLLYEPWEIYDENGHAFTTADAYWDKCLNMQTETVSHLPPWRLLLAAGTVANCSIDELGLENESEKSSNALLGKGWSPGWSNADMVLTEFVEQHLLHYSNTRLKVGGNSTSLLSPYLHFGELSIKKVFHSVRLKQILWTKENNSDGQESVTLFLKAIGLREYSRYLCFNFPFTHEKSLLSHLKFFPWNADLENFKAWRQGRTGYPLVDAGMRELWATGWIHNRIRVVVSSFSVKVLLLPWKWGMKYFWDTLLDADLECDILGWQYISGSLPDGHELERLDCPQLQGSKFDPEGEYIRHWLPELSRMPTEWIHNPWDAPFTVLNSAGVDLGSNYPKPIIDIDEARDRLREAIFKMWEKDAAEKELASSGESEVVVDNSECIEPSGIPKVILKDKSSCFTYSANDQKVPSFQNAKKRAKCMDEEEKRENGTGPSRRGEEALCSTAESSAVKRQIISKMATSETSFSVPRSWSEVGSQALQESEPSGIKDSRQEDVEQS